MNSLRKEVNSSVDKKVFTRTASSTKAVNLSARIYRGGLRF